MNFNQLEKNLHILSFSRTFRDTDERNNVVVVERVHGQHFFGQIFLCRLSINGVVKVYLWNLDGYCSFFTVAVLHLSTEHFTEVALRVCEHVQCAGLYQ